MKSYSVTTPALGTYNLMPHPAEEDPGETMLGYVVFEDNPDRLVRAIRLNKKGWTDHRNRRFEKTIIAWYSMETPDGTPLFW